MPAKAHRPSNARRQPTAKEVERPAGGTGNHWSAGASAVGVGMRADPDDVSAALERGAGLVTDARDLRDRWRGRRDQVVDDAAGRAGAVGGEAWGAVNATGHDVIDTVSGGASYFLDHPDELADAPGAAVDGALGLGGRAFDRVAGVATDARTAVRDTRDQALGVLADTGRDLTDTAARQLGFGSASEAVDWAGSILD